LASQNLTFSEFFDKVNQIYGVNDFKIPVPGYILNTLGAAGNLYNCISTKKTKLNLTNSKQLSNKSYFSGKKAERVLGLQRNSIDQAIKDAIGWFISNNYIKPDLHDFGLRHAS